MKKIVFLSFILISLSKLSVSANVLYDLVFVQPASQFALKTYKDDFIVTWAFSNRTINNRSYKNIEYTIVLTNIYDETLDEYTTKDTFQIVNFKYLPVGDSRILFKLTGRIKDDNGKTIRNLEARILPIDLRPQPIPNIDTLIPEDTSKIDHQLVTLELLKNNFFINALHHYHFHKEELGKEYKSFFNAYVQAILNHNKYNLILDGQYPRITVGEVQPWGDFER